MSKFKQLYEDARDAFAKEPESAVILAETEGRLTDSFHSRVRARDFALDVDEPEALGGEDNGPTPPEYLLAALGSCQEITYRLYADALGIPVNSVSVKLEGRLDLRGFVGVDEAVRPGCSGIRGIVRIDSPASEEDLKKLKAIVDRHCPILDTISNPTPVSLELEATREDLAAAQ